MGSPSTTSGHPLQLALLGYGKMGKAIAELAPQRGFHVRVALSSESNREGAGISAQNLKGVDVCLDFSRSDAVMQNLPKVAELGVNLVVGTTGWQTLGGEGRLEQAREIIRRAGVGMVYAANFSIGVHLFSRLARFGAELFAPFAGYEPSIVETHHPVPPWN